MLRAILLPFLAFSAAPALAGSVTIDLSGLREGTGDLYVSLQTADEFMRPTGRYGEIVRKPAAGSRTITLRDVAPGTYAVSVWHDVNGNGRWDMAPGGKPADGWAMVNGDKLRGMPTFADVSFPVGPEARTVTLEVRYGE